MKRENILTWIEQAQEHANGLALIELDRITRDLELKTTRERKESFINETHSFWFNEYKRHSNFIIDPLQGETHIAKWIEFLGNEIDKLPNAKNRTSPESKVKAIVTPAYKAKRVLELIDDIKPNTYTPPPPKQKDYSHKAGAVALMLAVEADKIPKHLIENNKVGLKEHISKTFIGTIAEKNPQNTYTYFVENRKRFEKFIKEHPDDYELGLKLYEKYF